MKYFTLFILVFYLSQPLFCQVDVTGFSAKLEVNQVLSFSPELNPDLIILPERKQLNTNYGIGLQYAFRNGMYLEWIGSLNHQKRAYCYGVDSDADPFDSSPPLVYNTDCTTDVRFEDYYTRLQLSVGYRYYFPNLSWSIYGDLGFGRNIYMYSWLTYDEINGDLSWRNRERNTGTSYWTIPSVHVGFEYSVLPRIMVYMALDYSKDNASVRGMNHLGLDVGGRIWLKKKRNLMD